MGLGLGTWCYLSSVRMPTERDASAVTASTSASAPGTLDSQESGEEAKRCMQPQYFPRTKSWVSWGRQAELYPRPIPRLGTQAPSPRIVPTSSAWGSVPPPALTSQQNTLSQLTPTLQPWTTQQIQYGYKAISTDKEDPFPSSLAKISL